MSPRLLAASAVIALASAACSSSDVDIGEIPELPAVSTAEVAAALTASEMPVVLNVWASWCVPCRSEAPLLERAASRFDGQVHFIALNVRDGQTEARRFIAEFFAGAPLDHWSDRGGNIPTDLGGSRAVPLTFFFHRGGELLDLHSGVLDERTLALQIDELLARS